MASTVTLLELRNLVRLRCDQQNSVRITDAQVNAEVNRSIKKLHALVVEAAEDDYTKTGTITTVAGTDTYSMAADFMKLRHISVALNGRDVPLRRFQLQERQRYTGATGWSSGNPMAYRLVGRTGTGLVTEQIVFLPAPTSVHTVTYWYVPSPQQLSGDTDGYDARSGFEDWICWDAAIPFLVAEESDPSGAMAERDRVYQTVILPLITTRDEARVDRVIDVEAASDDILDYYIR